MLLLEGSRVNSHHDDCNGFAGIDAATGMTPLPQPTAMTSTQTLVEDAHDLKMYKEHAIVEI
jgi:hypothetical protein